MCCAFAGDATRIAGSIFNIQEQGMAGLMTVSPPAAFEKLS